MKKPLTIAVRLAAGFGLLVALSAIAALLYITTLRGVRREVETVATDSLPGLEQVYRIQHDTLMYRLLTTRHALAEDPTEMDEINAQCDALAAAIVKQVRDYAASCVGEESQLAARLEPTLDAYREVARQVRALSRAGKTREAFQLIKSSAGRAYADFESAVTACVDFNSNDARHVVAQVQSDTARGLAFTIALGLIASGAAVGAGFWITRSVNRALQGMAADLDEAAVQVASAAAQVAAGSQGLAEGASEQAASLEESSSSLEELSSMTRRNADHAASAKTLSAETRAAAEAGNTDMADMRRAMDAIKGSSSEVSKIIKTIDEIAFQTNILALNAAVEAARAGEAGAGFAVVADEVRALAQRSATAAKETAVKIEESIDKGEHGAAMSAKVADSLAVIMEKARKVDQLVGEITTASSEQSQGIAQINTAVGEMDKVTQTNAGNAEETAAAAEELNAQSAALRDSVEQLRALVGGTTSVRSAAPAAPPPGIRSQPAAIRPVLHRQPAAHPAPAGAANAVDFFA